MQQLQAAPFFSHVPWGRERPHFLGHQEEAFTDPVLEESAPSGTQGWGSWSEPLSPPPALNGRRA